MPASGLDHEAFVAGLLDPEAPEAPEASNPARLARAIAAVWTHASVCLGDAALATIVARVARECAAEHPLLAGVRVDASGIDAEGFARAGGPDDATAREAALRTLLARLLGVLGTLTSDVLTPRLYAGAERAAGAGRSTPQGSSPAVARGLGGEEPRGSGAAGAIGTVERWTTGEPRLDAMLDGGLPRSALVLISGAPGSGKTILASQAAFANAAAGASVVFFQTMSEPVPKVFRHLQAFEFFDPAQVGRLVHFVDLGAQMRAGGPGAAVERVAEVVHRVRPAFVVIDGFASFRTLTDSDAAYRRVLHELVVELMAWEVTALVTHEHRSDEALDAIVASAADGLIELSQRIVWGERRRFVQICKMRGSDHAPEPRPFVIDHRGVHLLAAAARDNAPTPAPPPLGRCRTGVPDLDVVLGGGLPRGATTLLSGAAGSGKTTLALEILARGAIEFGERGLYVSFGEGEEALLDQADSFGLGLREHVASGRVTIVAVPASGVMLERDVRRVVHSVRSAAPARVVVDSLTALFQRVDDAAIAWEKLNELADAIARVGAAGVVTVSVPHGSGALSRFGAEEVIADGLVRLTFEARRLERNRFLEVLKMRGASHLEGMHAFVVRKEGCWVFPRYLTDVGRTPAPALSPRQRVSSGVESFDGLFDGGLLEHSVSFVTGNPGVGKTTWAIQFLLAGAAAGEPGLLVSLAERPEHPLETADALGLPLRAALASGAIATVDVPRLRPMGAELVSIVEREVRARGVKRLVIDGAAHITAMDWTPEEVSRVFYDLVVRSKDLGVTSMFMFESASLWGTRTLTNLQVAALADNYVLMEYTLRGGCLARTVMVLKSRCSDRDAGIYEFTAGPGGLRRLGRVTSPTVVGSEDVAAVSDA